MRINLTQGASRVLKRADELTQPHGISVAAVLCALFEETECRAFHWLEEAGLKIEMFRLQFGFYEGLSGTLLSPISAPPFPMGSYGVPPGTVPGGVDRPENKPVEAGTFDPIDGDKPGIKDFPTASHFHPREEPDKLDLSEKRDTPQAPLQSFPEKKKEHGSLTWFVNEEQLRFSKTLPEVELAVLSMLNRIRKSPEPGDTSVVFGAGGMVMKIKTNSTTAFHERVFELGTEHLLLAVTLADDPLGVGPWIREQGLDPTSVYDKIEHLYRQQDSWERPGEEPIEEMESLEPHLAETKTTPASPGDSSVTPFSTFLARLLDAAANRAREAVRVVEDYVRFVLDDSRLTGQCKAFRHELTELLSEIPHEERLESRDTPNDVGTVIQGGREYRRETVADVLASNFARLQESLRSLEEYGKLISVPMARGLERLRYQSYSLHKAVFQEMTPDDPAEPQPAVPATDVRELLRDATLYVLLDCRESEATFTESARTLVDAGVDVIQLRDKKADDRTLLARAKILREWTAESRTIFIMNDRPDLAKLVRADGVHVGQEELSVEDVRKIAGREMLVGVSTHTVAQIRAAIADGADYVGVGPVFPSSTKSFDESLRRKWSEDNGGENDDNQGFPGLELLRKASEAISFSAPAFPLFAIGGITRDNLDEILSTGVCRVAVSSAILDAPDPKTEVLEFSKLRLRPTESPSPGV